MTANAGNILAGRMARFVGLALVAVLFVYMAQAKYATLRQVPAFDPADDTGLFWTENAFHYRYAKMAAEGRGIPEVDVQMQYPEGMHVLRDEMPMMERFAGFAFRHLARTGVPFHVFLMALACAYSCLLVFPAYFVSSYAWRNALSGTLTSLYYVLTYSFMGSVVLGAYIRQDFVLPVLFLATYFLLVALDSGRHLHALLAALLLAFSFVSWHLSQFYYLVLFAGVVAVYFLRPESRAPIASTTLIVALVLLATSFFFLPLRSGLFPLSLVMLATYALLAQHFLVRRPLADWKRLALFAALLAVLAGAVALLAGGHFARYSHVYRLVFDKIRLLGVKPADPLAIGFETRVMWTSSFLSPPPAVMLGWLSGAWLAGVLGAGLAIREMVRSRQAAPSHLILLWMAAAFVVLFALIQRMDVFAGFFVCVLAGRARPEVVSPRSEASGSRPLLRKAVAARVSAWAIGHAVLLAIGYRTITTMYMVSGAPPADRIRPILEEIRRNTRTNDVILATFPFSPAICAYTERPVVVHSKFENRRVREKVEEFYTALYEDEETFYRFCRKYDVRYFIYEPGMLLLTSTDSLRYSAGRLDLPDVCVVTIMHFMPEALRHFQLVYQSEHYRVFRVLDESERPQRVPYERLPIYDSRRFRREDLRLGRALIPAPR